MYTHRESGLYKRLLRIALLDLADLSLHSVEEMQELENFYAPIEKIAQDKPETNCQLISVYQEALIAIERAQNSVVSVKTYYGASELFERIATSLSLLQKDISSRKAFRDVKQSAAVVENFWIFACECSILFWRKHSKEILSLMSQSCESFLFLEHLILSESLMLQFFQDCFILDKKELVFCFFKHVYPKMRRDSDVSLGVRNSFFSSIKRYCECLPKMIDSDNTERTQFGIQTMTFIIRLFRALVEDRNISDFQELFEQESQMVGYASAYTAKV